MSIDTVGWRPLLETSARARALEAVRAIARDVAERVDLEAATPRLASGTTGFALLFSELARATGDEAHRLRARSLLDHAVARLPRSPTLYSGFPGVAWVASHTGLLVDDPDGGDPNEELDEVLVRYLERQGGPRDSGLIYGLAGIGVYALERLPRPAAARALALVVERLAAAAVRVADGIVWLAPAPGSQHSAASTLDHVDLGPAHGLPGILAFLGHASSAGIEQARELLEEGARWLSAQPWARDSVEAPYAAAPGGDARVARLAWCYGDLGISASLLVAARAAGLPDLEELALGLAHRAALRPEERSGVDDAGLCHGAAGVGHVFNRLHQATGEEVFASAARRWLGRALDLREPGAAGVGGFRGFYPAFGGWIDLPGLLEGSAGIALALLAAAGEAAPGWDRMLLLS